MQPFVIVGIRRTGTTLIRTTLDQHKDIRCYGELFTFRGRLGSRGFKNKDGYRHYLNASLSRKLRDFTNRTAVVTEFLDKIFATHGYEAVGLKLMYPQHQEFPMVIPYLKSHNAKVIHVVRENVLKTLISRTAKKITGKSHTTKAGGKTVVTLREHRLLADLERFERENRLWEDETHGMPYLRVGYEDFVQNKPVELMRMQEFLGVEPIQGLNSELAKGNSDNLKEIIANYDEVAGILKGTRFEWCLTR